MSPLICRLGAYIGLGFDHAVATASGTSSFRDFLATQEHQTTIRDLCWAGLLACSRGERVSLVRGKT
ncbi:hypothetical protein HBI56_232930 [Parastagonospora nodorum]|uniref:Uncharacterized protein n=1 Tax=Phaeosphaeria nodorum (strain SN15 / ATCC MYA-4574 / FGSC 10173) TaxID=321614 RepID=A0A7U2F8R2_PHANO|nr:hypothetical protein HBH56_200830 [Parastagonospora nodorum]QRD00811.1 hypothetical protein JI435_415810 [Parastagonospora nodorum SN15]KAH3925823.1 hypothetical protein HBH54_175470 [Parastagonospora nodorum]KAH3976595.1 hypothetical protein HBH52_121820 [Parastagonospora nodorum]KAH4000553.1 hypothetical protein HBI10_099770 [Parastagonospora nodorum]